MKIYIKCWDQFTPVKFLWWDFTNRDPIALQLVCEQSNLTLINSKLKAHKIIDTTVRIMVKDMRKLLNPDIYVSQMRNLIIEFCEHYNREKAPGPLEVIGYDAEVDFGIFKFVMEHHTIVPPDTFMQNVVYRDLRDELLDIAQGVADEKFSLESPFSLFIKKDDGARYTLSQKLRMILSHNDCPSQLGSSVNMVEQVRYLAELDKFILNANF